VIVSIALSKPAVLSEFEPQADAIVASFGIQNQAILDILTGATEPSGLLPLQMPANMQTVEEQFEDVPHDMQPYKDESGNLYDFGFGLNWRGPIQDQRTATYVNTIGLPEFSMKDGKLMIESKTADVSIYYSLNDSIPSFNTGNLYKAPISVKKGQTIRAIAKKSGVNNSGVAEYKVE
jgi:beta-glucosidase